MQAFLGRAESKGGELTAVFLPVADTGLYEVVPTNNLGRSLAVPAGVHAGMNRSRYLVRFDPLSELPLGVRVTGVELRVQVTVAGTAAWEYGVHRMLRDWAEGNKEGNNGSNATAGETTWLAQYDPEAVWASPGRRHRSGLCRATERQRHDPRRRQHESVQQRGTGGGCSALAGSA